MDGVFDREALVDCARCLAALLALPEPTAEEVIRVVEHVVVHRGAVAAVGDGLLGRDEAVNLLLAHFHSELFGCEVVQHRPEPWADRRCVFRRDLIADSENT